MPLDFLAVFLAFFLSYQWRLHPEMIPFAQLNDPLLLPLIDFVWFSLKAALLVVMIFAWERMYSLRKSYRFRKELRRMLMLTGAAFTVIILYFFVVGVQFFSRFILGVAFVLAILFMLFHRFLLRRIQYWFWKKGIGKRRVLFIGGGGVLNELVGVWGQSLGFEIVGRVGNVKRKTENLKSIKGEDLPFLGYTDELKSVVEKYRIDEVVQVAEVADSAEIVEFCQLNYIEYRFVPNMLEVQRTNTEIDFVRDIPVITLRPTAIDWWARVMKRIMDILGSSLGLVLLSPLFVLVAVGIKLDSKGPVFYRSRRVSRNKQFWMWKFRSMTIGADKKKGALMAQNRRSGPLFKIQNDPRITRFGRFLRQTSLDEFPQLWNVLKGDLSLVGPRAHLPEEVAQYEKHHRKVLAVKAGATGLPQISGRSQLDFEKEVKLDIYYIENWSLWLDLKIILQTFGVLMEGE